MKNFFHSVIPIPSAKGGKKELATTLATADGKSDGKIYFRSRVFDHTSQLQSRHCNITATNLTFPSLPKDASNPLAKCQSTMEVKILVIVLSSNESMDMILMCRVNRSEMSLRPPPGGPMADTKS